MEIDNSQERGILQPDASETNIEEDQMTIDDDLQPESYTRTARLDRLSAYRNQIAEFFEQSQKVFVLLKTITLLAFLLSLIYVFIGWGTYIAALAMLNNLELLLGFMREGASIVVLKTELYLCRCLFVIIMKPVVNVIVCMLGGDTCRFGSPGNIGSELPLSLAVLTIGQVALLRIHKSLYNKGPGADRY